MIYEKTTLKVAGAAAVLAVISGAASASVLLSESFEGSTWSVGGNVAGVTSDSGVGQNGEWRAVGTGLDAVTATINNASAMNYSAGNVAISGGSQYVSIVSSANDSGSLELRVTLSTSSTRTAVGVGAGNSIYYSFLVRIDSGTSMTSGDDASIGFRQSDASVTNYTADISASNNTKIRKNMGGTYSSSAGNLTTGSTYLIVVQVMSDGSQFTSANMWVNPADSANPGTPSATLGSSSTTSFGRFIIYTNGLDSGESISFDELRFGTTWSDVVPAAVPEPVSASLLALVSGALLWRRKK